MEPEKFKESKESVEEYRRLQPYVVTLADGRVVNVNPRRARKAMDIAMKGFVREQELLSRQVSLSIAQQRAAIANGNT